MTRPLVLGHRGASGYRPELTVGALQLAAEQGADGVEIDVVPTRDGHLAVRHDRHLGATTNVVELFGWDAAVDELDLTDVARLRARERFPSLRSASAGYDGSEVIPTLPDVVALAEELDLLLVVEIKDASAFAAKGLDPAPLVARDLAGARCRIVLESFEKTPLDALAPLGIPCFYLIDSEGGAPDEIGATGRSYAEELARPGELGRFAGVSLAAGIATPDRVAAFHGAGLEVWAWSLRAENAFLPSERRVGSEDARFGDWRGHWGTLLDAGVDAMFTDHPDLAVRLLDEQASRVPGARPLDGALVF